jgi:hypothetical protein
MGGMDCIAKRRANSSMDTDDAVVKVFFILVCFGEALEGVHTWDSLAGELYHRITKRRTESRRREIPSVEHKNESIIEYRGL